MTYEVTEPTRKTREDFWEALECLPPSRWHRFNGVELFHICEFLTEDLVSWWACVDEQFFQFNDRADAQSSYLAGRVRSAL